MGSPGNGAPVAGGVCPSFSGEHMANFCYRAIDGRGRNAKGMIEAASQRLAVSLLHERGLVPLSVSPAASSGAASVAAAGSRV